MTQLADVRRERLGSLARSAVVGVDTAGIAELVAIGDAHVDSAFRIASLTKPVTAVATVLATRGAGVELDTPVRELLPDIRDDWQAHDGVTIAHVLAQTSGLTSSVTADDVTALGDGESALIDAARRVVRAGNIREPGLRWEYYNGNYFLAGAITAALYATTFERAVDELVLGPWGMKSTTFDAPEDVRPGLDRGRSLPLSAYARARRPSGGLCSTAREMLAFTRHLLADTALLAEVRKARTRPHDPMQYGLGWALGPSGQMYLNGGLAGCRAGLLLVPDHHLAGVALAADSDALPVEARILSDVQYALTGDDIAELIKTLAD
jgi:D-alanyl-D-alanine carboxypeptidase